jgi:hypothetical protein
MSVHARERELDGPYNTVGTGIVEWFPGRVRRPAGLSCLEAMEVQVGEDDVQSFDESSVFEETLDRTLVHQFGDLQVHAVEIGEAIVGVKAIPDLLYTLDNLHEGTRRWYR